MIEFRPLWERLIPRHVQTFFPQFNVYFGHDADARIGALAAYRLLAAHCFFCGRSTPWFMAIVGARVCRACFHKRNGPVELCSVSYAKDVYGLTDQALLSIPRLDCATIGIASPFPVQLILKRHAAWHPHASRRRGMSVHCRVCLCLCLRVCVNDCVFSVSVSVAA